MSESKRRLQAEIDRLTGSKGQSEQVKQALRFARGALKSTLATEREILEWVEKLTVLTTTA